MDPQPPDRAPVNRNQAIRLNSIRTVVGGGEIGDLIGQALDLGPDVPDELFPPIAVGAHATAIDHEPTPARPGAGAAAG